jgi:hypothetical protein
MQMALCRATLILDIVSHDCAISEPSLVVPCTSGNCLLFRVLKGNFFWFAHKQFERKFTYSGPIRPLPLTWLIYSESYKFSPFFYQLSIFTPKHLKMKFTISGLIRQLILTRSISSESHEYSPLFYPHFHVHTKAFENEIRIFWPN